MNGFLDFVKTYWLSFLLAAGLLTAVLYELKHKKKFEKNEFE
ncbi:hypothetical protein [Paenibacillus sp. GYB003]